MIDEKELIEALDLLLKIKKIKIDSGYMAGVYNGVETVRCVLTGEEPKFIENPDKMGRSFYRWN